METHLRATCPHKKHGDIFLLCVSPKGEEDPRFCSSCQRSDSKKKHSHHGNDSDPMTISMDVFEIMAKADSAVKSRRSLQKHYKHVVDKIQETKDSLEHMLVSYQKHVDLLRKQVSEHEDIEDIVFRMKQGDWKALRCKDIYRLKLFLDKPRAFENLTIETDKLIETLNGISDTLSRVKEIIAKQDREKEQKVVRGATKMEKHRPEALEKSIEELDEQIRRNPDSAEAYFWRGYHYQEKHSNYKKAEEDYLECLRIDPSNKNANNNLGVICAEVKKDQAQALNWFRKAFQADSKDYLILANLGSTYTDLKQYVNAEEHLSEAVTLNNEDPFVMHECGRLNYLIGKYAQAVEAYTRAIQLDSDYSIAYWNRAYAYDKLGRNQEAALDRQRGKQLGKLSNHSDLKHYGDVQRTKA